METFLANGKAAMAITLVGIAIATAAIFIAYYWYRLRRDEMITALKQDLLARGMSADDIRIVIEAMPRSQSDVSDPAATVDCPRKT